MQGMPVDDVGRTRAGMDDGPAAGGKALLPRLMIGGGEIDIAVACGRHPGKDGIEHARHDELRAFPDGPWCSSTA